MTMLDHEKKIDDCRKSLEQLKEHSDKNGMLSNAEIDRLEGKLEKLKDKVYSKLSPWERVSIARHPNRPKTKDYIEHVCDTFVEVFGDRLYADDRAIIAGFGMIKNKRFVVIGQEKGCDTESRLYRNFGMPHPEGYRKALRMMHLAEKFNLPVVTFLDTPGAYPGLEAEERGQGWAIAKNLFEMAKLSTPVIAVLIGEGCSGGALGMGVADVVGMLEHAYYSVISPEGCASILWKDAAQNETAASALKLHAESLLKFGIIDHIIKEPQGGAHHDPSVVYTGVKNFILKQSKALNMLSHDELLEKRYDKFRKIGAFTVDKAHGAKKEGELAE